MKYYTIVRKVRGIEMRKVPSLTLIIIMLLLMTKVYAEDNNSFTYTSEINFIQDKDTVIISAGISKENEEDYYKLTTTRSGMFTFFSSGSTDIMGCLYDSNKNLLDSNDDVGLERNFRMEYNLIAGKTYYIKIRGYKNETGLYDFWIKRPQSNNYEIMLRNFPLENQEKSNWCWSACSVSVLKYFGVNDISQIDFISKIKGHDNDVQGYPFEIKYGVDSYNIKYELFESKQPISFDVIKAEILKYKNPIIVGLDLETTRHAVVIVGYSETSTMKKVMYMDPYTGNIKTEDYHTFSVKTLERLIKQ
jgi:hypothetical protein